MNDKQLFTSFHSGYFYCASSSPLLRTSALDTARILCQRFTPKHHRQLRVKDLLKVPMRRLDRDLNLQPFGGKAPNLPTRHHATQMPWSVYETINYQDLYSAPSK